jgi:hypothetical protein
MLTRVGFFLISMGFLCLLYLILSLRTNVVFAVIFFTLVIAFALLTGVYWHTAQGNADIASKLLTVSWADLQTPLHLLTVFQAGGAILFVTSAAGWWIWFAIMLAALDFPFQLPVGDLSTMIKGGSVRMKEKESMA